MTSSQNLDSNQNAYLIDGSPLAQNFKMDFASIATLIEANEFEIIRRWQLRAKQEISGLRKLDDLTVRNHIIFYLKDLTSGLKNTSTNRSIRQKASHAMTSHSSEEHGRLRAAISNYKIEQLIHEYALLRQVITDFLSEQNLLTIEFLEALNRSNEQALLIGATEFTYSISRTQQKLASTLIHDIRNPLAAVRMSLELIGRKNTDDKRRGELIQRAQADINRIDRMTGEILSAMRLKAGQVLELDFRSVELKESLRPTFESIHLTYPGRVNLEITPEPIHGYFGMEGIIRMLENLITNSVKYGDPNRQITLRLNAAQDDVIIEVHNWGTPIPEGKKEQIFFSFNRSGSVKQYSTEGWGLGLTFVRAAADIHQGKIELESSLEHGTTFRVRFPKNHPSRKQTPSTGIAREA